MIRLVLPYIFYENKRDCDSNKKELRVWSLNFTPVEHL
jgi:hypothetical protein